MTTEARKKATEIVHNHRPALTDRDLIDAVEAAILEERARWFNGCDTHEPISTPCCPVCLMDEKDRERQAREKAELIAHGLARGLVAWTETLMGFAGWALIYNNQTYNLGNNPNGPVLTDEAEEVLRKAKEDMD